MGLVTAYLSAAVICFAGECYPMLSGITTPTGNFPLVHARTETPGYGGDVLTFAVRNGDEYLSVHRVYTMSPKEKRIERLKGNNPTARRFISNGCINVMPKVYSLLVECCSGSQIEIKE